MSIDDFLRGSIGGGGSSSPQQDSFVEGTFHHATDDGIFFTVDTWDGGKFVFGPAPWSGGTVPDIGAKILVMFLGGGVENPWVLGLSSESISPAPDSFRYVHTQGAAATHWVVSHGLNGYPAVTTTDFVGNEIKGHVTYIDLNNLTVDFLVIVDGKAYCS